MRHKLKALGAELRNRDGFFGPVVTLVSGTAIAHGITALALVATARLYSPEDFGVLAMYSSIVYTIGVAACLRLDVAIVLPREVETARDLLWLSLLAAALVAGLGLVTVAALRFGGLLEGALDPVGPYLWLVPLNLLTVGCYAALQGWFIRTKAYPFMSATRIVQSAGAAGTQVGAGLAGPHPLGLIAGFIINSGAAAILMGLRLARTAASNLSWPGAKRLRSTLHQYRDFPRFSVWEALANSGAIQLPLLLIAVLTTTEEVGQVALAMAVVQAPLALFGTAAAQVFMSRAAGEAREGRLDAFTLGTVGGLAKTGGPMMLAVGLASPFAFPILFGSEWTQAGILVAWMAPWLLLQFLVSPISTVLNVVGRLRLAMLLQFGGLALRLAMVWAGARFFDAASESYALSGAVFYAIMLAIILRATRG